MLSSVQQVLDIVLDAIAIVSALAALWQCRVQAKRHHELRSQVHLNMDRIARVERKATGY